jgi:hypothetical protein
MDVGRSFGYMFEDKDWAKKLLLGGLFNLIPVFGLVTAGYALRVIRQSARGEEPGLPEWDEIGTDWVKGLMQCLGLLILAIPFIPGIISSGIASDWMDRGANNPLIVCCFGLTCLTTLWMLFVGVIYPMARAHYAQTDEFASFFRFRKLIKAIGQRFGDYVVVLLLIVVVQSLAAMLGSFICGVGVAFTGFWAQLVVADLIGQVAAENGEGVAPRPTPRAPRPVRAESPAPLDIASIDAELEAQVEDSADKATNELHHEDYGGPEA